MTRLPIILRTVYLTNDLNMTKFNKSSSQTAITALKPDFRIELPRLQGSTVGDMQIILLNL